MTDSTKKTPVKRLPHFDQSSGQQVTTELCEITPEKAAEFLQGNTMNRRLSDVVVDAYTRAMLGGDWHFTGDSIRFNADGELLDGQHRLAAIVKSGTTQNLLVIRGLPSDARLFVDLGRGRNARDNLTMLSVPNAPEKATISNLLLRWEMGGLTSKRVKIQPHEVVAFVEANDDLLITAVEQARALRREISMSLATAGATYFRAHRIDPWKAADFFHHLVTGEKLEAGSPILTLRRTIVRAKTVKGGDARRILTVEELYYTVRAWNAYRNDEYLQKLQLPPHGVGLSNDHFRMV